MAAGRPWVCLSAWMRRTRRPAVVKTALATRSPPPFGSSNTSSPSPNAASAVWAFRADWPPAGATPRSAFRARRARRQGRRQASTHRRRLARRRRSPDGRLAAQPDFYGLLLVHELEGGQWLPFMTNQPTPAWLAAVKMPAGAVRVIIVNPSPSAAADFTVRVPGQDGRASLQWLTGATLGATTGVSLGGAQVNVDGTWTPLTTRPAESADRCPGPRSAGNGGAAHNRSRPVTHAALNLQIMVGRRTPEPGGADTLASRRGRSARK